MPADERALVLVESLNFNVFEPVGTGGRTVEAAENVHQRGFSRTAGAHDGEKFTAMDVEIHATQGLEGRISGAVGFGEAAEFDEWFRVHASGLGLMLTITGVSAVSLPPVISVMRPSVMPGVTMISTGSPFLRVQTRGSLLEELRGRSAGRRWARRGCPACP